jgi:predicted XRE-type DNA-binding protein
VKKRKSKPANVERGSSNVFAVLGIPNADELDAKVHLIVSINQTIKARQLSQADAAKILGVSQPKVSALKNGRLEGFSIERLLNFLSALGQDVEIRIRPRASARGIGKISVETG